MAHELVTVAGDGVDRAGGLGLLGEAVDHGHHAVLVGDADVGAQVVVTAEGGDRLGQVDGGRVDGLVADIDAGSLERCLLQASDSEWVTGWPRRTTRFGHDGRLPGPGFDDPPVDRVSGAAPAWPVIRTKTRRTSARASSTAW